MARQQPRPRRRGSRRIVAPELRLAYGARARPLGHAVLSLLPPAPPPGAPCPTCRSSAGCLACRRWAHLLRDGDSVEYRRLVTRAVCAFAPAGSAPPPPRYTPGNAGHTQAKLVRETIKSIMTDQSCTTKNVLCIGSREQGAQSRCVSDLVSSFSWDILLHRIGDLHMCYILRHSSTFVSIKKNDYLQVSGIPLNVVLQKPTFATAMARGPQPCSKKEICSVCCAWSKKEIVPKLSAGSCVNDSNVGLYSLDANTSKFDALQSSATYGTSWITEPNCSPGVCNFARFHSIGKSTMCSSYAQNCGKRKRLYRWQRYSKRKKICCEDKSSIVQSKINNVHINAGAKVSALMHTSDPTGDTKSLRISGDINYSQTKRPYVVDVFDMRPSQCPCDCSASRYQSPRTLLGPASFLHLNTSPICFNCLILNSSKYLSVDSSIPRQDIFYNRRTSYNIFHGNHILNKRKRPDAPTLIKHIFGIKGCCAKYLKCVSHDSTTGSSNYLCLLKLMNNLTRNSRRCQYKKLFLKHCSVKSKVSTNVVNNGRNLQYSVGGKSSYFDQSFAQLEAYSTHQHIVSFIWGVLTRIVPEPLLGNSNSKRSLRINIRKFIELRRFETFNLLDCIRELKVSDYSWISNAMSSCFCSAQMVREIWLPKISDEQKGMNLLQCWINWLFSDIVRPLIQAYFYVTERESRRYGVFYYPKSVWRDLTSNAIASINCQNFKILRGTSRKAIKHLHNFSRVRFVPKAKDMRLLVNLKAKSKNGLLNKCHLILKKVRDENPETFGSSVFDYNDVHKDLFHFISSVRGLLKEQKKIYIVVADVSKAFDCISHDMALKVMDSVLKCDEYVMRKCTKVVCNRSNHIYRFNSNFCFSKGDNVSDLSIQLPSGGGTVVDQGKISTIRKKEVQRIFSDQIKHNILKIGQNFYLQKVGIAQGSKLSPNLCSLYYGHLENSVLLKFLHDGEINSGEDVAVPNSLLMRFIDDFILISFSKKHALDFINRMRRGFVYYNCYMNDNKYGFNFKVANSEHCSNRLYRGDDGVSFIPWSGLLVNCENLEIQADYTRYLGIVISSTITVKKYSSTKYLQEKLCQYMRPKCHPIFYDSMINSPRTVRLNLYQAFLLCAMKFHCYVQSMPDVAICKPEVLHIIKRTFRYMHSLIIKRTLDVELQYSVRPRLKLSRKETMWLGLSAYFRVLQKKQSRYKDLLALLAAEIWKYDHLGSNSDSLLYAVDDSHSSVFWKFKF